MLLTRFLPITLYDRPVDRISDALRDFRNKVIYACAIEMAFCLFSLPLGALRGGVAKLSAGMNVILLIVAAIGLWAAAKLSLIWLLVVSEVFTGASCNCTRALCPMLPARHYCGGTYCVELLRCTLSVVAQLR